MDFLPQVLTSVVVAALLGSGPGLVSLVAGAAGTALLPAIAMAFHYSGAAFEAGASLAAASRVPAAAALAGVVIAGFLRDVDKRTIRRLLERTREVSHHAIQQDKVNAALTSLNEELERRVAGQRDSVSALATRIRKMESLDLDRVLSALLEAVAAFSQASAAAIYEFDTRNKALQRLAWIGPEPEQVLDAENTVEGWVYRNNSTFSLRMVDDYLNLAHVDAKDSVLAYPLRAGDLPWGVLNVRELPFYRYNPVTEKNLGVVVALASSYIKKAVDFRDKVLSRPRNELTGLPGYGELLHLLGEELERRAPRRLAIAVVIVEFLGFEDIVFTHSGHKAFSLIKDFIAAIKSPGKAFAFHFREDGQIAFLLPDTDRSGASLFCLGLTETAGQGSWRIDGENVCLEIAFGIGAFPGPAEKEGEGAAAVDPESLLADAEAVLDVSKKAFLDQGGRCP